MPRHATLTTLSLAAILVLAVPAAFAQDDISKVNGTVEVAADSSAGSLSTVNGRVEIGARATSGDAETVNGRIEVGEGARVGDLSTVNGRIELGRQVQVDGDVETVNGSVFIDHGGVVDGSIATVNGGIGLVATQVHGGIDMVNGDLTVGIDSHVRGNVRYQKPRSMFLGIGRKSTPPRVVIGPNARVDGTLVFEREVELHVHRSARIGAVTGATARVYEGERAPGRGD